jgi:hypothetical protein
MFFVGIGNKISQHLRFMKANGNTHLFLKNNSYRNGIEGNLTSLLSQECA